MLLTFCVGASFRSGSPPLSLKLARESDLAHFTRNLHGRALLSPVTHDDAGGVYGPISDPSVPNFLGAQRHGAPLDNFNIC